MKPSLNASQLPFVNRLYNQAMYTRQYLNHQVSLISQSCLSDRIEKPFSPAKTGLTKFSPLCQHYYKVLKLKAYNNQASEIPNLHVLPRVFISTVTPGVKLYVRP